MCEWERVRFSKSGGESGFTLIELLVVVAIIGVIAAAAIPNLLQSISKAKWVKLKQYNTSSVRIAMDMFYIDNGRYPTESEVGGNLTSFLKSEGYLNMDISSIEEGTGLKTDGGIYTVVDGDYSFGMCLTEAGDVEDIDEDDDGDACLELDVGGISDDDDGDDDDD